MMDDKQRLLQELDQAREDLWAALDDLDSERTITPVWNKRDFLAHMGGWDALMFTIFGNALAGIEVEAAPDFDLDAANTHFVAARQSFSAQDAQLECDINRFALKTLLLAIPASDYGRSIQFPWGCNTVVEFIEGAIEHEREHLQDVIALRQRG